MTVLLLGFDPRSVPGVDAEMVEMVEMAITIGQGRFDELGIATVNCFVRPDETADAQIVEALQAQDYECVVIGGGVRKPEEMLEFFERVVNLVHRHAPNAAIAFNSNPMDSADAALRWLGRRRLT